MTNAPVHETISIDRNIKASPDQVFAAWKEPHARAIWGAPSASEAIEFVESDFRVGSRDVTKCGPNGDLRFRVETRYYAITPSALLIFTESVFAGDALMSTSLVTVTLDPTDQGTKLGLTVQIASLVGAGMIEGNRSGWTAALGNLLKYLT